MLTPGFRCRYTPACGLPALRACYWAVIMHSCAMRKERSWLSDFAIALQSIQIIAEELPHTRPSASQLAWLSLNRIFGCVSAKKMKNLVFHFVLRSTCAMLRAAPSKFGCVSAKKRKTWSFILFCAQLALC